MTWVLVIYIYAGFLADGDSVTMTNVPGFATEQGCREAGNKLSAFVAGTKKEYRFGCIEQK